ncbi:hypothetical protein DPEC_G00221070 [Dallia pectoralis]|uniref:Uncharacterized protein n=1 Tax=Dallia pectoralis TaxID=75939 RepID=A0ACC2G3Z8_DALPE|nr:hypothetical protein DPEC_G00221070 [Dallia pectoralis]
MAEKQTPTSKNGSRSSASSQYSNSSSKGSVAVAIARAKAEAAKARLSFAAKEMRMKMEKAQLEASIEFLQQEKETAAALAEAEALEAATDPNTEKGSSRLDLNLNPIEPAQRTQEYLIQQAKSHDTLQSIPYVESFSVNETGQRHTGLKPTPPMLTSHYKTELISTPEDNTAAMDHRSPKSDIRPTQRSEHLTFSTHNTHGGQSVHWSPGAAYGDGDRPPDPYLGPTSQKAQDTSSFINALRRFLSVRGPAKQIRSDRGTNFIGACKELKMPSNINSNTVNTYLSGQGCVWTFNPPHASHMGGSWERMIGIARRILDSMFLELKSSTLTHEALTTLMAEVAAIINARPLVPVSTDPEDPFILTPATLLTQKVSLCSSPPGNSKVKDLFKRRWLQVQQLADTFWDRWRKQYLSSLQTRRKWQSNQPNIKPGSIVLLKDSQAERNRWPLGLITKTIPSKEGKIRKVEVKVSKPGGSKLFLRPITETVLLLSAEA